MYAMMANLPAETTFDLSSLRCGVSGGAAMPPSVMERFEQRYGVLVYEGDGPTECSPVTSVNPIGGRRKALSIGVPIPGVEMKVMDEAGQEMSPGTLGEVCVRARSVMKGYWRQPEETRHVFHPGGWLRTGDIGRMDDEGYFYLVDRRKDMIIVHGINVYPRQVEDVLYRHPAVAEAAVVGVPDELHGEMPKAFIALKPGVDVSPHDIIRFCREHLGRFEVPRRVEIRPELPKSGAGKILKRALRDEELAKRKT
jgi:long-chain acyl-CoA synthetase